MKICNKVKNVSQKTFTALKLLHGLLKNEYHRDFVQNVFEKNSHRQCLLKINYCVFYTNLNRINKSSLVVPAYVQ